MIMGTLNVRVPVEQLPAAQMWQVTKQSAGGQGTFVVEDGQRKMKSEFLLKEAFAKVFACRPRIFILSFLP